MQGGDSADERTGKLSLTMDTKPSATLKGEDHPEAGGKATPKKKRKSPANPWKKPKDMPKRPLSAYNLFFRDERASILAEREKIKAEVEAQEKADAGGRKTKAKKGMGFANLAKTISSKWNTLSQETKAPYEEQAAKEKARYDVLVAKWRDEQKVKAEKAKSQKIAEAAAAQRSPSTPSGSSSLESFSVRSYPSQWFHSGSDPMSISERSSIPSFVDTSLHTEDSSRTMVSSLTEEVLSPMQYFHSGAPSMRAGPFHMMQGQQQSTQGSPYSIDTGLHHDSGGLQPHFQDSFTGSIQPPMRASRMPGLESDMERIQDQVQELRRERESAFEGSQEQYTARSPASRAASLPGAATLRAVQPRHSSMPPLYFNQNPPMPRPMPLLEPQPQAHLQQQPQAHLQQQPLLQQQPQLQPAAETRNVEWHASNIPNILPRQVHHRMSLPPRPLDISVQMPDDQERREENPILDGSLRSLTENLDDDAIDFITSFRFQQP